MQIKCQCPYCRTKFSVDEEFIGQETECPSCNKNFRIKANVLSRIQLFTAQTYCWGKLYITISRCLAIAIIFSAFIFICIRWLANNHANNVTRQSIAAEYKKLRDLAEAGEEQDVEISLPDGVKISFTAEISVGLSEVTVGEAIQYTLALTPTGEFAFDFAGAGIGA